MTDYGRSLIRTFVPLLVGSVVTWLAARNVNLDASAIIPAVDAFVAGAYYALVRWAESRWPKAGWLLGATGAPAYSVPGGQVVSVSVSSEEILGAVAPDAPGLPGFPQ